MPRSAALLVPILALACVKQTGDEGQTTTTQAATETAEPGDSSSSGSAETETDSDTDTGDDSLGFVPSDDFPGVCSLDELSLCDELMQDCAEGEKCVPSAVEDCSYPRCVPILGDTPAGQPCTVDDQASDDCDGDSWCYPGTLDLELPSVCIPFCQGSIDNSFCDDPSMSCVVDLLVYQGPLGCRPSCDPLMPAGCEAWERCTVAANRGGEFACVLAGGVADGEACGVHQDCDSGLCVAAEQLLDCAGAACCAPWCDLLAPDCGIGLECVAVVADDPNSQVGVCALP